MGKRKQIRKIEKAFGAVPSQHYFSEDMDHIRIYHDHRRDTEPDVFMLDETTWEDLSMDLVFKRVNGTLSTSGEQYLYHQLRTPAVTVEEYESRKKLLEHLNTDDSLRLRLQLILSKLGKRSAANTVDVFSPKNHGIGMLLLSLFLVAALLVSAGLVLFVTEQAVFPFLALLIGISVFHLLRMKKIEQDFGTLAYSVAMISAWRKIRKQVPEQEGLFSQDFYRAGARAGILRLIGVGISGDELMQMVNTFFLLDIISYELTKSLLSRMRDEIFTIHEGLGRIDAAVSVLSYRKSLQDYCVPELDFSGRREVSIEGLWHPLISDAVRNDVDLHSPVLLTGSNASGKSTFLKAAMLCAVLSQSILTAPCRRYRAGAFHIYTSMAVRDNVQRGESYYIAEIKSLRRIFAAVDSGEAVFCAIDEVLRGTNTVERVAASCELLAVLAKKGALCLAATHDIELCELLRGRYALYHFSERISQEEILFDYRLRPGPSKTRNAIGLLGIMGFPQSLTKGALDRIGIYEETGNWQV